MPKIKKNLRILSLISFLLPFLVLAHPGGTDSEGCHVCRTNCTEKYGVPYGERHCHNTTSAPTPAPAPAVVPPPPPPPAPPPAPPPPPNPSPPAPSPSPVPTPIPPPSSPPPASPDASQGGPSNPTPTPAPPPAPLPSPAPQPLPQPPPAPPAPLLTPSAESPKDIQADPPDYEVVDGQAAQVSQPFLSKSSLIWLLSALGLGVLFALGYLVSRRV